MCRIRTAIGLFDYDQRGILEGCKLAGVPAFYPGRDFITVNRRVFAWVSFEVEPSGVLLFEAIIANRPYNGKDDLANRKIIPANVYNGIKDKIIARQK